MLVIRGAYNRVSLYLRFFGLHRYDVLDFVGKVKIIRVQIY